MEEELKSDELMNENEELENEDEEYCVGDCLHCSHYDEEFGDEEDKENKE